MTRLQQHYREQVVPQLMKELSLKNVMSVPRLTKITVNMGLGEAVANKKILESAAQELALITGQKPFITKTRKSVAAFKIREGWPIGCKVTLRRQRMYDFLDRLISVAIPRVRDFRGLPARSFDGHGNYSFGFREQIVFPEIDYDKVDVMHGMDVTITTSARDDAGARALLHALRFPIRQ